MLRLHSAISTLSPTSLDNTSAATLTSVELDLHHLLDIPSLVLATPRGGDRRLSQHIKSNINRYHNPHSASSSTSNPSASSSAQSASYSNSTSSSSSAASDSSFSASTSFLPDIRRAASLFRSGYISKAITACHPITPPPISSSLIHALESLNPPPSPDSAPFPDPPAASPHIISLTPSELLRSAKSLNNGSASGASGWSIPHLIWILQDAQLGPLFASVLTFIARGHVSPSTRQRLLASRLVAIPKPAHASSSASSSSSSAASDTSTSTPKIRPIAVGEVFYRIVAHCLLKRCGPIADCFPTVQKGFHPSGVDRVIHSLRAKLELHPDSILIATDFKAAFQTRDRSIIAQRLFQQPLLSYIHRFFHWAYQHPSDLLLFNPDSGELAATISNSNGVRQGDVLASVAFAVSVQQLFVDCLSSAPSVLGLAIIDDFSLVGPAKHVTRCFRSLRDMCAVEQFPLNSSKCFVYAPTRTSLSFDDDLELSSLDLSINNRSAPILGSVISLRDDPIESFALAQSQSHNLFFETVSSPSMHPQMSLTLLRHCSSAKLNHLSRTLPPAHMSATARHFDSLCLASFCSKLDLPIPSSDSLAARQIVLPLRSGGFGIGSCFNNLAPAFLSSLCASISDIHALLPADNPDPSVYIPELYAHFRSSFDFIAPAHLSFPVRQSNLSIHNLDLIRSTLLTLLTDC